MRVNESRKYIPISSAYLEMDSIFWMTMMMIVSLPDKIGKRGKEMKRRLEVVTQEREGGKGDFSDASKLLPSFLVSIVHFSSCFHSRPSLIPESSFSLFKLEYILISSLPYTSYTYSRYIYSVLSCCDVSKNVVRINV